MDRDEVERIAHGIRQGIEAYREKSRFGYADNLSSVSSPPEKKASNDGDFRVRKMYIVAAISVVVAGIIGYLVAKSQSQKKERG